jgi:hypothetical protein
MAAPSSGHDCDVASVEHALIGAVRALPPDVGVLGLASSRRKSRRAPRRTTDLPLHIWHKHGRVARRETDNAARQNEAVERASPVGEIADVAGSHVCYLTSTGFDCRRMTAPGR